MKYLTITMVLFATTLFAQNDAKVIEAATDKNVFLFFPSPITKALPGNGSFQFGYNTERAEKFGVLKAIATDGESTLHIITEDQSVYSFIIKYSKELKKFEYFFDGSEAVGNINNKPVDAEPDTKNENLKGVHGQKITEDDYHETKRKTSDNDLEFSKGLIAKGDYYKNIFRTKSNIVLKLSNIAYKDDKTFIVVTLNNKSSVDYDLNFIQFNKIAKKVSKKSNYQAIEIRPLDDSTYLGFDRIEAMSSHSAVYVFDKLSIDNNKLISIEINELQGERNLQLPIGHRIINNPNSKIH